MRFCRMTATTTMGHLQSPNPRGAQFSRRLTTDLVPLLVLEHPLPGFGVEPHPDRPPTPLRAHPARPVVQRHLALRVHLPGDQERLHELPGPPQIPTRCLASRIVAPSR